MSYKGQFTQKPLCQIFRFLRGREVPYGVGGEEWPCIVFRILYILVTGQKSAIISIPVTILLLLYGIFLFVCFLCSFAGFEGEREEKKDPELQGFHPQHAKAIRRNAWIFHDDLDTCHSKKSHFMVISHPWGDTLQITQLW